MLNDWRHRVQKTPNQPFLQLVQDEQTETERYEMRTKSEASSILHPEKLTFLETDILSDKLASIFYKLLLPPPSQSYTTERQERKSPPVVAILLSSSPFFVACYLGLVKAGASAGLININLRGKALAHAIRISLEATSSECEYNLNRILVVEEGILLGRISDVDVRQVLSELNVKVVIKRIQSLSGQKNTEMQEYDSNTSPYESLDRLLLHTRTQPNTWDPSQTHHTPTWNSTFFYVFTSGTTGGFAKASIIKHIRFRISGSLFSITAHLSPKDKVYCALPLYHSAAGMIGISGCISSGACMVIRPKFSASLFAHDLVRYQCTVVQYIGEFARYTLASKESSSDEILRRKREYRKWSLFSWMYDTKWNGVRVAFGNGMRPEVWKSFQNRFGIGDIIEFCKWI